MKVHLKAILRKIAVRNRTQAALWASAHHMLDESGSVSGKAVWRDLHDASAAFAAVFPEPASATIA